jgi:hypothetical protein
MMAFIRGQRLSDGVPKKQEPRRAIVLGGSSEIRALAVFVVFITHPNRGPELMGDKPNAPGRC